MSNPISIGEDYPRRLANCREALDVYKSLGTPARVAASMIEKLVKDAEAALASGDTVKMVMLYYKMGDVKL